MLYIYILLKLGSLLNFSFLNEKAEERVTALVHKYVSYKSEFTLKLLSCTMHFSCGGMVLINKSLEFYQLVTRYSAR